MESPNDNRIIHDTIEALCAEDTSYHELHDLYYRLRDVPDDDNENAVLRFALSQIVSEILDYLNLVSEDFEKSIGITRYDELNRISSHFSQQPNDELDAVAGIINQWRSFEKYSQQEIARMVEVGEQ